MIVSHSQDELDSRFANLLQPIRDLTKNWDVDIASSLEDYLEELDKIVVTFDGGMTTMNFAEAAMLIQGSVCVYSKKVEYLYTLVYQVLDLLASKKKQSKQSAGDGNSGHAADLEKNEDEEFLSLDDIQEHNNIVLKNDEFGNKNVMPIPQMPLSLIPLEEGEKGSNPLLSKKGEVLGSRNDFKINICSVHQSGTLLLDMSHMALLEKTLGDCISIQGASLNTIQEESTECAKGMMGRDNVEDIGTDSYQPPDVSMDDNADDEAVPVDLIPMEDEVDGVVPANNRDSLDAQILRRSERKKVQIVPPKPVIDHWKMIDPHDPGHATERNIKRGKTFKIPDVVDDCMSNKRKRKKKTSVKKLCPLTQFVCQTFTNVEKYPKNPLKTVSFPELDKLFWAEYKRRQSLSRKESKAKYVYVEEENEEENLEQEDFHEDDGDDAADILLPQMNDDCLFNAINSGVDHMPCTLTGSSQHNDFGASFDNGVIINDYEELVKQHVEQYLASAQEYAQITELSRRVTEWEERVVPKLEEEDTHEPFDINKYGSLLIGSLQKETNTAFKEVVKAKKTYEICRIFLASLMLANTRNVEIVSKGELETGMDKFELHLLSSRRHFEQLEEYQAPSIAGKG
ncbi:condensin-2 complex subunit H2-like isoform X2 [Ostrea edulis]|nr:condensin-2 complex subunit H2-like isoform X2 [Ostrea edulis]